MVLFISIPFFCLRQITPNFSRLLSTGVKRIKSLFLTSRLTSPDNLSILPRIKI